MRLLVAFLFLFCYFRLTRSLHGPNSTNGVILHRQKRYFFPLFPDIFRINFEVPMQFGLLISIPWTSALPAFNKLSSRRRRQIRGIFEDSFEDVAYSEELNKISHYFSLLEIEEDDCQLKFICEIFTDEEKFSPFTQLFSKRLNAQHGPLRTSNSSRFFLYSGEMYRGMGVGDPEDCGIHFNACPESPSSERIDENALYLWNTFRKFLGMTIQDDYALPPSSNLVQLPPPSGGKILSRKKRQYWNTASPIDTGLEWIVPLTFALPQFNFKFLRKRRELAPEHILPHDSFDEPAYEGEIRKVMTYFSAVGIEEDICHQRSICHLAANPDKYRPLSDLTLRQLAMDRGPLEERNSSRFYRFVRAMQEGSMSSGSEVCGEVYRDCPHPLDESLHLPSHQIWGLASKLFRIQFWDK